MMKREGVREGGRKGGRGGEGGGREGLLTCGLVVGTQRTHLELLEGTQVRVAVVQSNLHTQKDEPETGEHLIL